VQLHYNIYYVVSSLTTSYYKTQPTDSLLIKLPKSSCNRTIENA